MSTSVNPVAAFYPVLRLPQAEIFDRDKANVLSFYKAVIDAISNAASTFVELAKLEATKSHLEISLSSPELEACLPLLLDYAAERDLEISLASLGSEADYNRLAQANYALQIFAPGVVDGLGLRACSDQTLSYIPGVYSKHDFDLLTDFASQNLSCLKAIKIFPVTATDARDMAEFLEGPFPELKQARAERRLVAVSKDLREKYLMDKGFTMISSPSDYMMLRNYFLSNPKLRLLAVEPEDLCEHDISGLALLKYLRSEFPGLRIIAAGISSLNNPALLADIFSAGADAIASATFKLSLSRLQYGFELDDYPRALAEMQGEMAHELSSIYSLIYQCKTQVIS